MDVEGNSLMTRPLFSIGSRWVDAWTLATVLAILLLTLALVWGARRAVRRAAATPAWSRGAWTVSADCFRTRSASPAAPSPCRRPEWS
ncbi:MAG: hypothetical protein U0263_34095 [Polyangiaceae bacterium]